MGAKWLWRSWKFRLVLTRMRLPLFGTGPRVSQMLHGCTSSKHVCMAMAGRSETIPVCTVPSTPAQLGQSALWLWQLWHPPYWDLLMHRASWHNKEGLHSQGLLLDAVH